MFGQKISIKLLRIRNIQIAKTAKIDRRIEIDCRFNGSIKIGKYTSINGPNTRILSVMEEVNIGNYSSIGPGCLIIDYNHDMNYFTTWRIRKYLGQGEFSDYVSNGNISIGNNVWVGANVIILSGSVIEDHAVIGAGSLVNGRVEKYGFYAGSPAKKIKDRFNDEQKSKISQINWDNEPKDLIRNFQSKKNA